jgi:hypothetical protein
MNVMKYQQSAEDALSDFEEHKGALAQEEGLRKVLEFLLDGGASEEMINCINFAIEDNQTWINNDLLKAGEC